MSFATFRSQVAASDTKLARRIVSSQGTTAATVLPRLSNAANHASMWALAAGALAILGNREGRRAAQRGLMALGIGSGVANVLLKPLFPRERPPVDPNALPSIVRRPTSSSFPSGHSASAFAFATGVALESPALAVPISVVAAGVAYSRITTGVHYPSDVVAGAAIGVAAGSLTTKLWPRTDSTPAQARPAPTRSITEPSPNGAGLILVVNAAAGPSAHEDSLDAIEASFSEVEVVLVEDPSTLDTEFAKAANRAAALGVLGGDGTIGAAAAAALEAQIPLVVFPGGTLNHFARDLGVDTLDDAIAAVKDGQLVEIDTATIDGRPFLNTASFGGYSDFVEAREQYENQIGKWPAVAIALIKVLRNGAPIDVELNGERRKIWLIFIGNCSYEPPGFVPSTRDRLDDGKLDVRFVDGTEPFAHVRLIAAVLTGRLARSKVYSRQVVDELNIRVDEKDVVLAADGETFSGQAEFAITKPGMKLRTYAPHR